MTDDASNAKQGESKVEAPRPGPPRPALGQAPRGPHHRGLRLAHPRRRWAPRQRLALRWNARQATPETRAVASVAALVDDEVELIEDVSVPPLRSADGEAAPKGGPSAPLAAAISSDGVGAASGPTKVASPVVPFSGAGVSVPTPPTPLAFAPFAPVPSAPASPAVPAVATPVFSPAAFSPVSVPVPPALAPPVVASVSAAASPSGGAGKAAPLLDLVPPASPVSPPRDGASAPIEEEVRPVFSSMSTSSVVRSPVPVVADVDATLEDLAPVFGHPPPAPASATLVDPAPALDHSRSSRRLPFEINVDIVSEHNFYAGLSLNISEGGLFVATHVEYPVGTMLEIRLLLPGDEEPTAIMTEVRWVRAHNENADGSPGMGLRFVDLTPDIMTKIAAFAQSRDPLYYEDD